MSRIPSFPNIDLTSPNIDLTSFKNAAYLTVGLGVAAVERLDSARRAANAVASDAVGSLTAAVSSAVERVTKLTA